MHCLRLIINFKEYPKRWLEVYADCFGPRFAGLIRTGAEKSINFGDRRVDLRAIGSQTSARRATALRFQ